MGTMKTQTTLKNNKLYIDAWGLKISAEGFIVFFIAAFIFVVAILYIEKKYRVIRRRFKKK